MPQIQKLKKSFALEEFVLIGDRGMISQKQIDQLTADQGIDWITALRSGSIRKLIEGGHIQLGLFDERNLFELVHPDYPGERLVACRNPELARSRAYKRESLLQATLKELAKVQAMVRRGRIQGKDEIGVRVGKVINKYKVSKHIILEIGEDQFEFHRDETSISREALLDGIYVVRTSIADAVMGTEDVVRSYKLLGRVERAFRSIKTMDLEIRPIRHRLESRVRGHIFLCMLAYYVSWHMTEAWRPLLFCDQDQSSKKDRDPVAPAQRSKAALAKVHSRRLDDGTPVHSFQTLLQDLSTIVRNRCRRPDAPAEEPTFDLFTRPTPQQQRAYDLLNTIRL